VEFLKGHIEAIPLPTASVDVVISNCVVNLAADKPAVFREIARVLRPGGRVGISDIVAEDRLTPEERCERGSYVGCIAGALSIGEFEAAMRHAGLEDVSVTPTHTVADGMHGAIIRATKPLRPTRMGAADARSRPVARTLDATASAAQVAPRTAADRDRLPLATVEAGCCGGGGWA